MSRSGSSRVAVRVHPACSLPSIRSPRCGGLQRGLRRRRAPPGELMLYGRGSRRMATATAVLGDLLRAAARHRRQETRSAARSAATGPGPSDRRARTQYLLLTSEVRTIRRAGDGRPVFGDNRSRSGRWSRSVSRAERVWCSSPTLAREVRCAGHASRIGELAVVVESVELLRVIGADDE